MGQRQGRDQEIGDHLQAGIEGREGSDPRRAGGTHRVAPGPCPGCPAGSGDDQSGRTSGRQNGQVQPDGNGRLATCWMLCRCPAGKRLAPMLATIVPLFVRDGDIMLSEAEAALLVSMSAASIDRHLADERAKLVARGRSHTKPGTLLKSQIPIRTWAEWSEDLPGFVEIDLVGHEGGNSSGEFCFTLTVTDIATGWTVNRSVKNKAAVWVFEAIEYVISQFPFPILGIDSDNGSEFINAHLLAYCVDTRSPSPGPSRKQERRVPCRTEELDPRPRTGRLPPLRQRCRTRHSQPDLGARSTFTNYLLAQQKIVFKQRHGSKVTKRYDRAATPFERAWTDPACHKGPRGHAWRHERYRGNLYRQIHHLTTSSSTWR